MDLYAILGVDRLAPTEEIKASYKTKILQCHPDKQANAPEGESDGDEFQQLHHAWRILRDPLSRKRYDLLSDESSLEERPAISQEIDLDDMVYDEEEGAFSLECRCGDQFYITEDELEENIDIIQCSGCSLVIRVLFEALSLMREQVRAWIAEKDEIEARLEALENELHESGFGMSGGLVDDEGFPLSDVEKIWDVRTARNQIAMLRNDHTDLMKKIEANLEHCFAEDDTAEPSAPSHDDSTDTQEIENKMKKQSISEEGTEEPAEEEDQEIPFCRVEEVSFGSPAEEAGLKKGDLVTGFGFANHSNHNSLKLIRDVVIANVGEAIFVTVKRGGQVCVLTLFPKKWAGQGLLGCYLVPL